MKKFLLSAITLAAAASVCATVPQFNPSGSATALTMTNSAPSYYTPACASADNSKFFFAGQFEDTFSLKVGSPATDVEFNADVPSAYVVSYGTYGGITTAFMIEGAAKVTAMTCDASHLYVAGVYSDKITFHSASATGKTEEIEGLKLEDSPVKEKSASFIAVYDLKGELQSVKSFVPEVLPALVPKMTEMSIFDEPLYSPSGADVFFHISDIQYYGNKLYISAEFTGETKISDITLDGSYQNLFDMYYFDVANSSVVKFDAETLLSPEIAMSVELDEPVYGYAPDYGSITFNISKAGLYGAFLASGSGDINVKNGSFAETLKLDESPELYVLCNANKLTNLEKKVLTEGLSHNVVSTLLVDGGKVWMLGSADVELPSAKAGEGGEIKGSNDIFVATFSASDLSLTSVVGNESEEGTTDFPQSEGGVDTKANYELPQGAVKVNDYVMFIYNTCDFHGGYISSSTKMFTGKEFTTPASSKGDYPGATGIAIANGTDTDNPTFNYATVALPLVAEIESDVTPDPAGGDAPAADQVSFTYQYGSFLQDVFVSGINEIAADYVDENAPVEYYNLQGIRIAQPAEGQMVIRRQGSKTEKLIVR